MKKINRTPYLLSGIVGLIMMVSIGCKKDAEHYVRITNNFTEPMKEVKLDEINFGAIDSGGTTAYKHVVAGTFPVSITTKSGAKATGTAKVEGGTGEEYWTVHIGQNGVVSTTKDK